jgi:hypothetical protein
MVKKERPSGKSARNAIPGPVGHLDALRAEDPPSLRSSFGEASPPSLKDSFGEASGSRSGGGISMLTGRTIS